MTLDGALRSTFGRFSWPDDGAISSPPHHPRCPGAAFARSCRVQIPRGPLGSLRVGLGGGGLPGQLATATGWPHTTVAGRGARAGRRAVREGGQALLQVGDDGASTSRGGSASLFSGGDWDSLGASPAGDNSMCASWQGLVGACRAVAVWHDGLRHAAAPTKTCTGKHRADWLAVTRGWLRRRTDQVHRSLRWLLMQYL